MTLDEMQLAPVARAGAQVLLDRFGPEVVAFTSGYRTLEAQATVMAKNVVRNRRWIEETYTRRDHPSFGVGLVLQASVDAHVEWTTAEALTAGLHELLATLPNGRLISYHCWQQDGRPASLAFDLKPLETEAGTLTLIGSEVWLMILGLLGLDTALRREGGLRIWHAQFLPPVAAEV